MKFRILVSKTLYFEASLDKPVYNESRFLSIPVNILVLYDCT